MINRNLSYQKFKKRGGATHALWANLVGKLIAPARSACASYSRPRVSNGSSVCLCQNSLNSIMIEIQFRKFRRKRNAQRVRNF